MKVCIHTRIPPSTTVIPGTVSVTAIRDRCQDGLFIESQVNNARTARRCCSLCRRSLLPVVFLCGHRDEIEWLDFSPDGKTLASASRDGTVRL